VRRMRVVLSNASWQWGGVHAITSALVTGLQARGHEVVVFGRPQSRLQKRLAGLAAFEPVVQGMDLHPLGLLRIARALRRHQPDVALLMMKKDVRLTGPAARAVGVPVVIRHANDQPIPRGQFGRMLYGAIPALHVANSKATRRTLLESAPWLRPERVAVVHNGIDAEPFLSAAPAELGLPDDALAVGFLGRFDERKGVLDLTRAWPRIAAEVPDAYLVLAGKGPLEAQMRAELSSAPRVIWAGFRNDAAAFLAGMSVLAVPSHWEGFGLVAAEAMASGVPVVATRASSLPEIVTDGLHGRLVPPNQPEQLGEAIISLLEDPGQRARMGALGRERVRADFTVDGMVDHYEALLRRVVGD
jgi:glycosyltransferase involved in cell wall biosynthesis